MFQRTASYGVIAVLGFVLLSSQGRSVGVDPTTGRGVPAPAPRQASPTSTFIQGSGAGEVIGYTTDGVIPHYLTLDELTQPFDDLVADGHTLVPIHDLTPVNLVPLDWLYVGLVDYNFELSREQRNSIELFVRHGGKLVLQGENNTFFHETNLSLGSSFRIGFPAVDPHQNVLTDVNVHPITQGPYGAVQVIDGTANSILGGYGSLLAPGPNAFSLLDFTTGESAGIVIEPGHFGPQSGPVIAFAEINVWLENYLDGDNRALWRNTFAYDPAPVSGAHAGPKPGLRAWLAAR
jgi:hypothetical protein